MEKPFPTLHLGSRGDAVRGLQAALCVINDGAFGEKTLAAVKRFQRAHGLKDDGIVGTQTWKALEAESPLAHVAPALLKHKPLPRKLPPLPPLPSLVPGAAPSVRLDVGHGSFINDVSDDYAIGALVNDPGKTVGLHTEASINLAIATLVKANLRQQGIDAELTRGNDTVLPGKYKPRMAQAQGAVAYVSLHCDSAPAARSGIVAYYTDKVPAHSNQAVLAKALGAGATPRPHNTDLLDHRVLGVVPATLIEMGNMNNKSDLRRLTTPEGQRETANAISTRIAHYVREHYPQAALTPLEVSPMLMEKNKPPLRHTKGA